MKIPEELYNYIISGNCVLFAGAGASMEAGAPSAQEIAQELSEKYLIGQHKEEPLSRVAAYIEAKPGLGRRIVVDYLINRLMHLKPSKAHLLLPMFNWAAIYTTNYDTLIELTYEIVKETRPKCKPVISSCDLMADMTDESNCVLLYKPHGCISRPSSSETPLVITEDDYYSAADNRKVIYRQLELHKYRSVFLFIGYSFSDFNLSQIWSEVSKELGKFSQWAYALWPDCSEVQRLMWRARYVELIDARFGEFMTELSSISFEEQKKREFSISNIALAELIKVLLFVIEAKDPFTKEHSLRVQKLTLMIAEEMAIPIQERQLLEIAALLHDVGYVTIPDSIIGKSGALLQSEFEIIRRHTIFGEKLLSSVQSLKSIAQIVRSHHELFNGQGYPDGLAGENIPQLARIIAVADNLDALMSNRPYRRSYKLEIAVAVINKDSGIRFDPTVVSALNRLYRHNKLTGFW